MAAGRIDVQRAAVACVAHSGVVRDGVRDGRDERVVIGQDDDGGRGQVRLHLQFVAVQLDQFLVLLLIPEKAVQRALVRAGAHRDDGIDQDLEVRASLVRRVGGDGRCQVSAGGRAHDADVTRIELPAGRAVAHHPHRILGVRDGESAVPVRYPVVHQCESDALAVEELMPGSALVRVREDGVAAARTGDDGPAGRILRQIDDQFRRSVGGERKLEFTGGLREGHHAQGDRKQGKEHLFHDFIYFCRTQI